MDIWVLIIGGGALVIVAALGIVAEYYIRNPEAIHKARVRAWERAELDRVGPEVFHGTPSNAISAPRPAEPISDDPPTPSTSRAIADRG